MIITRRKGWLLIFIVILGSIIYWLHHAGFRVNLSASLPVGIWQIKSGAGILRRGQIVSFCLIGKQAENYLKYIDWLPQGQCGKGGAQLIKPIVAIEGDEVLIKDSFIAVNDRQLKNSARHIAHSDIWPSGLYNVATGQLWVVSSYNENSFDSRYFGPIMQNTVLGVARPIWLWDGHDYLKSALKP